MEWMTRAPDAENAGELIFAFGSKKTVMGFPDVPEAWTERAVEIVPQRCTVFPGPICDAPLPQLDDELKNDAGFALAHEEASAEPPADWAI